MTSILPTKDGVDTVHDLRCFPPLYSPDIFILIVGSMPGKESLRQQQYYAHARNAFWPIMMEYLQAPQVTLSYYERCQQLLQSRIGLWDVIHTCQRETSLDADIQTSSIIPNDFSLLFDTNSSIKAICFNGRKAESVFLKYAAPNVSKLDLSIDFYCLPSTSPANASLSLQAKKDIWFSCLDSIFVPSE